MSASGLAYLVLTFCLSTECQTIYPPEPLPLMECMTSAQQQAAQWINSHPSWTFSHFKCVVGHKPGPIEGSDW